MRLREWFLGLFDAQPRVKDSGPAPRSAAEATFATHVIVLDGTMSSLLPGRATNAGRAMKLLREGGRRADRTVYYEAGIQWRSWRSTLDVVMGRGLDLQIERAYGALASRWRPGDRIVLIGYSRGAFAVRSLAGVIGSVGLVKREFATVRHIRQAYRHYKSETETDSGRAFRAAHCHRGVEIEAVAVWDTVKALGLRLPIIWRWAEAAHQFHDHHLGAHVKNGFHALALDETREAYAPVLWETPAGWKGRIEQVWFRGSHGDVGGQIDMFLPARPLSNIPLKWLLERVESCGVKLPEGWADRFPSDPLAPSCGSWSGWGKLFLSRRRRIVGRDPSERLDPTVFQGPRGWWGRRTLSRAAMQMSHRKAQPGYEPAEVPPGQLRTG